MDICGWRGAPPGEYGTSDISPGVFGVGKYLESLLRSDKKLIAHFKHVHLDRGVRLTMRLGLV